MIQKFKREFDSSVNETDLIFNITTRSKLIGRIFISKQESLWCTVEISKGNKSCQIIVTIF